MNRHLRALPWILLTVALSSCARHVVLDPEVAAQRNSPDWKIKTGPATPGPDGGTG